MDYLKRYQKMISLLGLTGHTMKSYQTYISAYLTFVSGTSDTHVVFRARTLRKDEPRRTITLTDTEFIRGFLMHVLPTGYQKIRYYGFLNNQMKSDNLQLIFKLQGHQRFKQRYANLSIAELSKPLDNATTLYMLIFSRTDNKAQPTVFTGVAPLLPQKLRCKLSYHSHQMLPTK